jgi:hypothetical protein
MDLGTICLTKAPTIMATFPLSVGRAGLLALEVLKLLVCGIRNEIGIRVGNGKKRYRNSYSNSN